MCTRGPWQFDFLYGAIDFLYGAILGCISRLNYKISSSQRREGTGDENN